MTTEQYLIQNAIDASTLRYAKTAVTRQYMAVKERQQQALNATPVDWDAFNRASAEAYALAGVLGTLGLPLPEDPE